MKKILYICLILILKINNVDSTVPCSSDPNFTSSPTSMRTPQQPSSSFVTGYFPIYVPVIRQDGTKNLCLRFSKRSLSLSEILPLPLSQSGVSSLTAISAKTYQSQIIPASEPTATVTESRATLPSLKELLSAPPRTTIPPLAPVRSIAPAQTSSSSTVSNSTTTISNSGARVLTALLLATSKSLDSSSTDSKTTDFTSLTSFEPRLKSTKDSKKLTRQALRKMTVGWNIIPDTEQCASIQERINSFNAYTMRTQNKTGEWTQLSKWFNRMTETKRDINARMMKNKWAFSWWKGFTIQNTSWKINLAVIHPRTMPLLDQFKKEIRSQFIREICTYDNRYCELRNDAPDTGKHSTETKTKYGIALKKPFPAISDDWEMSSEEQELTENECKLKKQIEDIVTEDWREYAQFLHKIEARNAEIPSTTNISSSKSEH